MASRSPYPKPEDPRRALFTNPIGISPWITIAESSLVGSSWRSLLTARLIDVGELRSLAIESLDS